MKPADTGKPEVKPVQQTGTAVANAQTPAPKADAKAAASAAENKMETLPNTGESDNSTLLTLGATILAFVVAKLSFRKKS